MQRNNHKHKKAQSFVEFSFLIVVTIGVLIVMISYANRSLQGNLKQHVDNLGGERLEKGVYSPGRWYGAGDMSGAARTSTWGFDYEGRMGFGVSTEGTQITSYSTLINVVDFDDLAPEEVPEETVLDGEENAFVNSVYGSSFDPGIQTVQQNVNNDTQEWTESSGGDGEETGSSGAGLESQSESIYDEYGPDSQNGPTQEELNQLVEGAN